MAVNFHVHWSSDALPLYFFRKDAQRVPNVSAEDRNNLRTLRITEEDDGYGLNSLDVQGIYQFKRFEVEEFEESLEKFPSCFGTDFEEVSFVEVAFDDRPTAELFTKIIKSPNLKSLTIENVTFPTSMEKAVMSVINGFQFEHLKITGLSFESSQFEYDLSAYGYAQIVKTWQKHPNPRMRSMELGEIGDDYSMDIRDIFKDELEAFAFAHPTRRQIVKVDISDPLFLLEVAHFDNLKEVPKSYLIELPKAELADEIVRLQKRVQTLEKELQQRNTLQ